MNIAFPVSRAAGRSRSDLSVVDYDIHGLVGVRLIDASPADRRVVEAQLGLRASPLSAAAAVILRFVDELPIEGRLHFLGRDDVAFTSDAFVILRSRNLARARSTINFAGAEAEWKLTCERGLPAVPYLKALINLAMVARGIAPVHATAFDYEGQGVLVTGWSHGSKTGTLLSFMAAGARFVGDEWIYLGPGGERMFGLPDKLEARLSYLRQLPTIDARVTRKDRWRMAAAGGVARALAPLVPASERRSGFLAKTLRHAHRSLLEHQSVELHPEQLFSRRNCVLESALDVVVLALSHSRPEMIIEPRAAVDIADRMTSSFLHEHDNFLSCYRKQLFAFPDRRSPLLDALEGRYRALVVQALAAKRTFVMSHPYPPRTKELFAALAPVIQG